MSPPKETKQPIEEESEPLASSSGMGIETKPLSAKAAGKRPMYLATTPSEHLTALFSGSKIGPLKGPAPVPKTFVYGDFLKETGQTDSVESRVVFLMSMVLYAAKDGTNIDVKNISVGKDVAFMTGTDHDSTEFQLKNGLNAAKQFVLDLVACYQVRDLKISNVVNYFKMAGMPSITGSFVHPVIVWFKDEVPSFLDNKAFPKSDNPFIKYHTNYATTGTLVKRVIESLGDQAGNFFKDSTIDAVNAACENLSDAELNDSIPLDAVALTATYLEVNGVLPENWYQGNKAVAAMPISKLNAWKGIFKKYKEIASKSDTIDAAKTADELFTAAKGMITLA